MYGGLIKHPFKFFLRGILYRFLVGWGLVFPLALLMPKRKRFILFIGRDDGQFIDNVKYLFLYIHRLRPPGFDYAFLTENRETYRELKKQDYPVLFHPTWRSVLTMLRTPVTVVDNINWIVTFKNQLLYRGKKIQLFHAVPIKRIGTFSPVRERERQYLLMRLYQRVTGHWQTYDWFLSPSPFFTQHVFSRAYPSRYIFEGGLPRNDALFWEPRRQVFSGDDRAQYDHIAKLKGEGKKIVLYMPTFRDRGKGAFHEKILHLSSLDAFAGEHNIQLVVKYHQIERARFRDKGLGAIKNILFEYHLKDIYPFLPLADALVTDYSSIYFDFLLLDRPIVFFPYDLEAYTGREAERGLIFDYHSLTPGPKCFNQAELQEALHGFLVRGEDAFKEERAQVAQKAFKYRDGRSSERIWQDLETRFFS